MQPNMSYMQKKKKKKANQSVLEGNDNNMIK